MQNEHALNPFDVVVLLERSAESKLCPAAQGTVVDIMSDGIYEVEFCDDEGRTLEVGYFAASALRLVWSAATGQFVAETNALIAA